MRDFSVPGGKLKDERGVTMVFVAITLVMLLSFGALAVDLGHLYVVRNELQNAADAGALAGASVLYNDAGTLVNTGANEVAHDTAESNKTGTQFVQVNWTAGNAGDVQRGHYSFATRTFTPNDATAAVSLWNVSAAELDADPNFINAVRVVTRRTSTPSFLARIMAFMSFNLSAEAVAYIGFAGTILPHEVDQPIAICEESILDANGKYTCGVGRMINSGSNPGHETGGWTNFSQPCVTASTSSVKPLVCASGNPYAIELGQGMGTTNGEEQAVFNNFVDCWKAAKTGLDSDNDGWPDHPWKVRLPVVECPGNSMSNCSEVVGSVVLNIVWITQTDKNQMKEVPKKMWDPQMQTPGFWTCPSGSTGAQCWNSFVQQFKLKDVLNNTDAFYEDKTIYFLPDCEPHKPSGRTGGENFGVLAKLPVLVR